MIIYVKWIFAVLLTVPMLLLGLYLLRKFNVETRNLKTERAMKVPEGNRRKKR
ncbi:MAG: hypothetical protein IJH75_04655 [Mogibacterium sp.]|nr:hypothetical protein [Mogibacterium sp.]